MIGEEAEKAPASNTEILAQELQISRSRLFALAAEEFIQRHQNQKLLEAINDACDDLPDAEEQSLHQKMRQQHRHLVEGQVTVYDTLSIKGDKGDTHAQ